MSSQPRLRRRLLPPMRGLRTAHPRIVRRARPSQATVFDDRCVSVPAPAHSNQREGVGSHAPTPAAHQLDKGEHSRQPGTREAAEKIAESPRQRDPRLMNPDSAPPQHAVHDTSPLIAPSSQARMQRPTTCPPQSTAGTARVKGRRLGACAARQYRTGQRRPATTCCPRSTATASRTRCEKSRRRSR